MEVTETIKLPADWYAYEVRNGVSENVPGIYEWHIQGVGHYIGQYGRIRRPTKEYGRNVVRLLNSRPYRAGNEDGFRHIHRELGRAVKSRAPIKLIVLENVADPAARNARERQLIRERGSLNSPPYGGARRPTRSPTDANDPPS